MHVQSNEPVIHLQKKEKKTLCLLCSINNSDRQEINILTIKAIQKKGANRENTVTGANSTQHASLDFIILLWLEVD